MHQVHSPTVVVLREQVDPEDRELIDSLQEALDQMIGASSVCDYYSFVDAVEEYWSKAREVMEKYYERWQQRKPAGGEQLFDVLMAQRDAAQDLAKQAFSQCGCQFRVAYTGRPHRLQGKIVGR